MLTSAGDSSISAPSLLVRGRVLEAILKAERGWRSRGCARNAGSGGSETVRRALRPVLRGARCNVSGGNAGEGSTEPNHQIARWSAERRARRSQGGRRASPARPLQVRRSALRRPSSGRQRKVKIRAQNAPRKRRRLFDIVRRAEPGPLRTPNVERSRVCSAPFASAHAALRPGHETGISFWPNKPNRLPGGGIAFWPNKPNRRKRSDSGTFG